MSKQTDGYIAGIVLSIATVVFAVFAINSEFASMSQQLMGGLTLVFGILGILCFKKPETIGAAAFEWLRNIGEDDEETPKRRSYSQKQSRTKFSHQVQTGSGSSVTIIQNSPSRKKKKFSR